MKNTMTDTELLGDLLFAAAQTLGGSRQSDEELVRLAKETFDDRHFFVVRHWMLLDVMLPSSMEQEVKAQGLQATLLHAQLTVFDSHGKHLPGDSLLSDYQRDFDACIFESKNALYILAGRGARKYTSWPAVEALRAFNNADVNKHVAYAALNENLPRLA